MFFLSLWWSFTFTFTNFLQFWDSQNMASLQVTNWSKWCLQAHRVFKNFADIEISSNPKVQSQVSTMGVLGRSSQAVSVFLGFAKRREIWRCPDGRQQSSNWKMLNFLHPLLRLINSIDNSTCLNWTSDFSEGALPIPPDTHHFI